MLFVSRLEVFGNRRMKFEKKIQTHRNPWLTDIARREATLRYLHKYGLDLIRRGGNTVSSCDDRRGHLPHRVFNRPHSLYRLYWARDRQLWGAEIASKAQAPRRKLSTGRL